MARDGIKVNDRQLACARIGSQEGQDYLTAMACAANYAWVNRSSMTFLCRQAFAKLFKTTPDDLDMHVVYDVSHNIAKASKQERRGCPCTRGPGWLADWPVGWGGGRGGTGARAGAAAGL